MRETLPWLVAALPAAPLTSLLAGGRSKAAALAASLLALAIASILLAATAREAGAVGFDWSRISALIPLRTAVDRIGAATGVALSLAAVLAAAAGGDSNQPQGHAPRHLALAAALACCAAGEASTFVGCLFAAAAADSLAGARESSRWFAWQCLALGLLAASIAAAARIADGSLHWALPGRWTLAAPAVASACWVAGVAVRTAQPTARFVGAARDAVWPSIGQILLGLLLAARLSSELIGPRERILLLSGLGFVAVVQAAAAAFSQDRGGAIRSAINAQGTLATLIILRSAPGATAAAFMHVAVACVCGSLLLACRGRFTRAAAGLGIGGMPFFGAFWTLSQFCGDLDVWAATEAGNRQWLAWAALGATPAAGLLLGLFGGRCLAERADDGANRGADAAIAVATGLLLAACVGVYWSDAASGWLESGRIRFSLSGAGAAVQLGEPAASGYLGRNIWLLVVGAVAVFGAMFAVGGWSPAVVWRSESSRSRSPLESLGTPVRWLDATVVEGALGRAAGAILARPVRLRRGESLPWTSPLTLLVCLLVMLTVVFAVRWR